MKEILTQGDFIGPIKPQMNMTYRVYLQMINTGLGLPRYPSSGVPIIKTEDDMICPPSKLQDKLRQFAQLTADKLSWFFYANRWRIVVLFYRATYRYS